MRIQGLREDLAAATARICGQMREAFYWAYQGQNIHLSVSERDFTSQTGTKPSILGYFRDSGDSGGGKE